MNGVPPTPSLRDILAVLASGDVRAQTAALAVKPPNQVDPSDVQVVMAAAREAEAQSRGGVDVEV